MKILYITNHKSIAACNGGYVSNYMNDLLFYGLYEILGSEVVDSTPIISLYKEYENTVSRDHLWGGFTSFWLIDNDIADRTNIEEKIKDRHFDLIIYGAIKRCQDYYPLVSKYYPKNKTIIVDGSDEQTISEQYLKHPYFKRELYKKAKLLFPISFSIHSKKICEDSISVVKSQSFGSVFPGIDETYTFSEEASFYEDYRRSLFGLTMKKDGWDCMRHYEILANRCMPYFIGLEECPSLTMVDFPKDCVITAMRLFNTPQFNEGIYFEMVDEVFEYTKERLTTRYVAEKLLEKVL